MRDSMAGTWLMSMIITFTIIFTGYITMTIVYSRAFKVKNEMLTMIEKNQGLNPSSKALINNYLISNGVTATGGCGGFEGATAAYGAVDINGSGRMDNSPGGGYYYCVAKFSSNNSYFPSRSYYKVRLFFNFNLPVFGHIFTFDVDGQTAEMDVSYDEW